MITAKSDINLRNLREVLKYFFNNNKNLLIKSKKSEILLPALRKSPLLKNNLIKKNNIPSKINKIIVHRKRNISQITNRLLSTLSTNVFLIIAYVKKIFYI